MNFAEWMTQQMADSGVTLVLERAGKPVTEPVRLSDWLHGSKGSRGEVVFGPYANSVRADSIRVANSDAEDVIKFGDELGLPAGQVYRYALNVGVERRSV